MLPSRLIHSELERVVRSLVGRCEEIYLVGGAVRDYILQKPCNDIDFVLKKDAIAAARAIADQFKGDFYILDEERGTARALFTIDGNNLVVDCATLYGDNIHEDLAHRDFTINAIAQQVNEDWEPIDPLGGINDLHNNILRPCSADSFQIDPVRTIRAVRFTQKLDLQIDDEAIEQLEKAVPLLTEISAERKRDELFHVFETRNVKSSMVLMRQFGIWNEIFPRLEDLETIVNVPPHVHNALEHTLSVLNYCQKILYAVSGQGTEQSDPFLQSTREVWESFTKDLRSFLAKPIHPQRKYDGLLFLAVLYHDIGKLFIPAETSGGRVNFPGHAEASARFFKDNHQRWALSNAEYQFVRKIISGHTVSKAIMDTEDETSRRELYRFFDKADSAGVLIGLFYLADIMATYEDTLTAERWQQALRTSHALLESWFRKHELIVDPPRLVDGSDLIRALGLQPGKQIGQILEEVREAQSAGIIKDRKTALEFAENWVQRNGS